MNLARREMDDAFFNRDRLTQASKRLGERLNVLRAIERAKAQRAEHETVAAERERLAMELERLAEPMAEVAALVAQIDQVERKIKLLNVSTGPVLGYIRPTLSAASPVIATLFGDGVVWDAFISVAGLRSSPVVFCRGRREGPTARQASSQFASGVAT